MTRRREIVGAGIRFGFLLAAAGLVTGCGFKPLYARDPSAGNEGIGDKLAEVIILPIPKRQGSPEARIAVSLHNALAFDLNGGADATVPTHQLKISLTPLDITMLIDDTSGRPTAELGGVKVTYQLIEIATGKIVVIDTTSAHVDYDIPGSQQRFVKQRSLIDAQDRAAKVAAEAIRNRLASYFVAGT